jgi:hypothetical protein
MPKKIVTASAFTPLALAAIPLIELLFNMTMKVYKVCLRAMVIRSLVGKNLQESGQRFVEWDVMKFAEMMGN